MARFVRPGTSRTALLVLALILLLPATAFARSPSRQPVGATSQPSKAIEQSINKALAFLAKAQNADGTFAGPLKANTAITSLCVMAFLAEGHTPGHGPYGSLLNKSIDNVIASAQPDGMLLRASAANGPMYSHAISTLMLSEVSGMVDAERQKRLDRVLGPALKLILAAQTVPKPAAQQGGWRYQANSKDSDISVTGWALMALRSARNSGAAVPKSAIDQAVGFLLHCRMPDGGFAYQPGGGSSLARTGTGLLSLELAGNHRDKVTLAAGDYVLKNMPKTFGGGYFYYGLYYSAQGMYQLGGDHWEKFSQHMYKMMLSFQKPDGSWPNAAGGEGNGGPCYSTAMSALAMSVSFCQLPIYQR